MRSRLIVYLALFAIIDVVIPVPLLALLLLWVVTTRPAWFLELVRSVYDGDASA